MNAGDSNPAEANETVNELPESNYQKVSHFFILCLFSFGVYLFFWFYRHWRYLRDERDMNLSPGFRTLFIIFTGYNFFSIFKKLAKEKGYKPYFPFGFLFFLFTAVTLLSRMRGVPLIAAFLSLFSFLFLIPALQMMNFYYLREQTNHVVKQRLETDEKIFLLFIWVLIIFSAFFCT